MLTRSIYEVYFIYPETCGVRLEDMNSLFGDASTVAGTPSIHGDTGSLLHPGSPQGLAPGGPGVIPPMTLDPPEVDDDSKSQVQPATGDNRTMGSWLSRVVRRGRADSSGSGRQGRYAPLGQQEEGARDDVGGNDGQREP